MSTPMDWKLGRWYTAAINNQPTYLHTWRKINSWPYFLCSQKTQNCMLHCNRAWVVSVAMHIRVLITPPLTELEHNTNWLTPNMHKSSHSLNQNLLYSQHSWMIGAR
jgi:hypothetical protein